MLALILPVLGYLIAWYISEDKNLTAYDETGLAGVVLTLNCLGLGTVFGIVSLFRREVPRWVAWTGLGIAWVPIFGIAVVPGLRKVLEPIDKILS